MAYQEYPRYMYRGIDNAIIVHDDIERDQALLDGYTYLPVPPDAEPDPVVSDESPEPAPKRRGRPPKRRE